MDRLTPIDNRGGAATRRLIRFVDDATTAEIRHGLGWYELAHATACTLANENGVSVDTACGVIAALSPRSDWPQNVKRARELLETGDTYGLGNGRGKAKAIVAGADPLSVLSGPKTRAFYLNVADPEHSDAVTVDAHAFDAAAGRVTDDRTRKVLDRVGEYDRVADFYRRAARSLGLAPHATQAIVWTYWRNRFGQFHFQHVA